MWLPMGSPEWDRPQLEERPALGVTELGPPCTTVPWGISSDPQEALMGIFPRPNQTWLCSTTLNVTVEVTLEEVTPI